MNKLGVRLLTACCLVVAVSSLAHAQTPGEHLCDVAFENCRSEVIDLIRKETVGIDWSFWITEDARYANELVKKFQAGVPVRVAMDLRANANSPTNQLILAQLKAAGIPMRYKSSGGVEHMKMMLFAGQNRAEFSGANYSPFEYVPATPWVNYEQESIYFTDDPAVVNSLRTRYDNIWTNTTNYQDYANVVNPKTRNYDTYPIDPELNFPPVDSYTDRLLPLMDAETEKLYVVMFRITDARPADAMIRAVRRGVDVRLVAESQEYRNPERLDDSYNLDRMYKAGVPIRVRAHEGINHQKSIVFGSQKLAQLGSSNWSTASDDNQAECNYFTTKPWFFTWFSDQFDRMWNNGHVLPDGTNAQETKPFVPLPPDKPINSSPANGATAVAVDTPLRWKSGYWARVYDIYLGTSSDPPLYKAGVVLGPSTSSTDLKKFAAPDLLPGTTYYWKVVSRTMADLTAKGPIWSFTTAGTAPSPTTCTDPRATNNGGPLPCTYPPVPAGTIVLWMAGVPQANLHGRWQQSADTSAAGGSALWNPDAQASKVAPALASPSNYFETTFTASSGTPYHLWVRMRAQNNYSGNDSVHVQFNDAVNASGAPIMRIGTADSAEVVLQNGSGAPIGHSWGWTDNGWGSLGANISFASSGSHTIRVQQREDGPFIDQIVLSSDAYTTSSPGSRLDDTTILQTTQSSPPPPPDDPPTDPPTDPPPPPGPGTIVLWTANVPAADVHGRWQLLADTSAAGAKAVWNPNKGSAKVAPALATPANYFETTFTAPAATPFHLWLRMRAENNSSSNDSVHVQFNDTVACTDNAPTWRIGTQSSAEIVLQNGPNGAVGHGWGWSENGWGAFGANVCFASGGSHVVRVQQREDGPVVDQIVISSDSFLTTSPGTRRDDTTVLATTVTSPPPPPDDPPPPSSDGTVVMWMARADAASVHGNWQRLADTGAAGGSALWNPNANAAKVAPALGSPTSHFQATFPAETSKPYHLWLRLRAQSNGSSNDSVHVQFDDAVRCGDGSPMWRIGTQDSAEVVLQNGPGGALGHGWGWSENGWGAFGIHACFASTGTHTIRVQQREDGAIVDQIVLSPDAYLTASPGARRDDATILDATVGADTPPKAATIVREPFLQQVTSTSAYVVWATQEQLPADVRVSSASQSSAAFNATATFHAASATGLMSDYYQYVARIDGLTASTTYAYQLQMNDQDLTAGTGQFTTAPATGTGTVRFLAFGDSGVGSSAQFALASRMAGETFDFALHLGDVAYGNQGGTGAATYQSYQSWFFNAYKDWLRTHAIFPAIGNHDDATANAQVYRDVFVLPENGASASFPNHAERFYSFDYGQAHFVVLDTESAFLDASQRQAQLDWLSADLAGTTQPWRIVTFHRSPFSSGTEHGSDLTIRAAFAPVFERYGVQLVLSGHDHDYERTVPIQTTTDPSAHAVTYVVSGGGGGPLYTVGSSSWTAVSKSVHHYMRVAVDTCQLTAQAVDSDGAIVDSFSLDRCTTP